MATDYVYIGSELELFANATHWKSYLRRQLGPWIGTDVLEVGAGLGGTTKQFCKGTERRWLGLEPDERLATQMKAAIEAGDLPNFCEVEVGTLNGREPDPSFDTLLYIDVLEHIEDDAAELARAAGFLRPGGHAVVLSPAHQWLYSPFDRAIGHFRRYTKKSLRALTPPSLELVRLIYLDTVGLAASLGNRLVLRKAMPNPTQIAVWDRYMVRLSTVVDPLLGYTLGKSILGVWRKRPE